MELKVTDIIKSAVLINSDTLLLKVACMMHPEALAKMRNSLQSQVEGIKIIVLNNSVDFAKELYAEDKDTGKVHKVSSIFFPLGKPSGKDITITTEDCDEWRNIDEIELISDV